VTRRSESELTEIYIMREGCLTHRKGGLSVDSVEEAERIYAALMQDGEAYMPLQETYFASRFSQLRDQFGTLRTLIQERPMS